jgi:crotonobetainyl-CoA:carnitine CoA-transferase CaiB-like acyl-CoA transferase
MPHRTHEQQREKTGIFMTAEQNSDVRQGPLAGIRVVDLTSMISGPVATMMLADQGADVIKVEALEGDLVRGAGATRRGITSTFISSNRSKRALALDLKTPEGVDALKTLLKTADVMVQNFRPGAIERMGFGEDVVRCLKDDIIFVSISGFGDDGPYAHQRVYDPVIQALSGLAAIQADGETGRPKMIRTIIPDKTTAVVGKEVTNARAQLAPDLIFETQDGYITAGAMSNKEWRGMCTALGHPEWLEDPRFLTVNDRAVNATERLTLTGEVLATNSSSYWLERLDAEGVPSAPVLSRDEVITHPQIQANDLIHEYDHPIAGRIRQPRPAARFDKTPSGIQRPAPGLGEHSAEILTELGYAEEDIARLVAQGVLGVMAAPE